MQQIMPPTLCDELWDHDRHMIRICFLPLHGIDELEQRLDDTSIMRAQNDQAYSWIPQLPFFLHLFDVLIAEAHVDGHDVIRQ